MNDCVKSTFLLIFVTILIIFFIEFDFFNNSMNDLFNLLQVKNKSNDDNDNNIKYKNINNYINNQLELGRKDALEEIENFENNVGTRNDESKKIEELINNIDKETEKGELSSQFIENIKIVLLYKLNCPHSQLFIPTWNRVKENLPKKYIIEEIDCSQDMSKCIEYGIEGVPALYVEIEKYNVSNDKTEYKSHVINGNMSYIDLIETLKHKGVRLNDIEIENYVNYISAAQMQNDEFNKNRDPDCPAMSFNMPEKGIYCVESLDNLKMIRGCSNGSRGNPEGLTEFDAAYNTFGTYLSSLPTPTSNNMTKCIKEYKNTVRQFGLCKPKELEIKSNYSNDIKNKKAKQKFLKTDYKNNQKISNSLLYACSI